MVEHGHRDRVEVGADTKRSQCLHQLGQVEVAQIEAARPVRGGG